jgi:hypothetical protein
MFQFSGLASALSGYQVFNLDGLPHSEICGSKDYLRLPRSLSQLITSFFASESLGIHRTLLFTFLLYALSVYNYLSLLPIRQRTYSIHPIESDERNSANKNVSKKYLKYEEKKRESQGTF